MVRFSVFLLGVVLVLLSLVARGYFFLLLANVAVWGQEDLPLHLKLLATVGCVDTFLSVLSASIREFVKK